MTVMTPKALKKFLDCLSEHLIIEGKMAFKSGEKKCPYLDIFKEYHWSVGWHMAAENATNQNKKLVIDIKSLG